MQFAKGRDIVETGIGAGIRDHDQPVPHQHSATIGHSRSSNASAGITSQFRRGLQPISTRRSLSSGLAGEGWITLRVPAARCVRVMQETWPKKRAQETPGARCTRSRAWCVVSTRVSHHRSTGTPGISCAMVLTAYFALSPVTGLSCHRRPRRTCFSKLDTSVGVSGPHDFAVRRTKRPRQKRSPASIASRTQRS